MFRLIVSARCVGLSSAKVGVRWRAQQGVAQACRGPFVRERRSVWAGEGRRVWGRGYGSTREEKEERVPYDLLKSKIEDLEKFTNPPPWEWVQKTVEYTETHFSKDVELLYKLGTIIANKYSTKKSRKYALRLIKQGLAYSKTEQALLLYAKLNLELKNFGIAEETYKEILQKNPKSLQSYNGLGTIYVQMGKHRDSIRYFYKALEVEPQSVTTMMNVASSYFAYGKFDVSLKWIQKAKDIDPKNPMMYLNLGDLYANLKEEDKALEQYTKAIELNPDLVEPYGKIGDLLASQQKFEEAAVYLDKAIEKDPKGVEYLLRRANLSLSLEERENPFPYLQKALEMNPYNPDTLTHLGIASEYTGESEAAMKYFNAALEYDPDHIEARLNLGTLYNSMNLPQRALETVLPLKSNKDMDSEYLDNIILSFQEAVQSEEDRKMIDRLSEE